MTFSSRLLLAAASLLCAAQTATAIPHPSNNLARALVKRHEVTFEDCGGEDDKKQKKAAQAWKEAANLASTTIIGKLDDETEFKDTNAFKHYFEADDGDTTRKMYSGIQAGSSGDSGNAFQLKFIITCKKTDDCKDSLALTDAKPNKDDFTAKIRLCPKFFDENEERTKNHLTSKELIRDPKRRDNSWCQPNQPFKFFETASHTFLHEMTHLNQLGVEAGLFPDNKGDDDTHGTEDIYQIDPSGYDPGSPEKSGRKLKDNWVKYNDDNKNKKPELQRIENAESYAAAATEFYFQKHCKWDEIME
ncbi:MAG: hypothetical protein LQ337_008258 [Flavoplaca oasis]|nr:MAG: hypothetical protein LQ337_008258 [Flavoplaca oasis]